MTAIVGIVEDGEVWMGADSAAIFGDNTSTLKAPKIARNGEMLIGCAGGLRVLQIVHYVFEPPSHPDGMDALRYMVGPFVAELRRCLGENGTLTQKEGKDETAPVTHFLIGYRGRLFYMDADFTVTEPPRGWETSGSGCEVAAGVLHTLQTHFCTPDVRIRAALNAAADLIWSVSPPFHIEKL
ncbi:MAG: hypothetical protein KY445_08520 [Armatimonadetes bacterium]|nr:hypothetical protein [Armatimonadota bacterium]